MATYTGTPGRNEKILFWASFFTLIAAGIGFSVRSTSVLTEWGKEFGFTQTELGAITGGGLIGFGVTIIVGSFIADLIGYGKLMLLAFFFHVSSAVVTLSASWVFNMYGKDACFMCLNLGMWLFSLGNGTCEAVINPLTATLFPNNKTHWLNILHAGWPGGLILGAILGLVFENMGNVPWQVQIGTFLVPTAIYGLLMFGRHFPRSEASVGGVSIGTSLLVLLSPILLFLYLIHAMVGYVELGTDSWIKIITSEILSSGSTATILFIWTSGLMFVLRFFAGPIVHKISPLGLLFFSAVLGATGLVLLGKVDGLPMCFVAATVYGLGKTFFWPTMLGVISERFPKGGAIALGFCGGIGMISAGLLGGPGIGYKQDYFSVEKIKELSEDTYKRYKSDDAKSFPVVSDLVQKVSGENKLPPIAGLDNTKVGIIKEYKPILGKLAKGETLTAAEQKLGFEKEIDILREKGISNEQLNKTQAWWESEGKPHAKEDAPIVIESILYGSRQALIYTAAVPATMAICYLLLILWFKLTGGYRQIHIDEHH
jgi:MFS family permease